jgi:hypothetical protein
MKDIYAKIIKQMASFRHILPSFILAIGITTFSFILVTSTHAAPDLNNDPNAVSGSELVQIVVLQTHEILNVSSGSLPGSGSVESPYITENAGFDVNVELKGSGHLVIYDQYGNILGTYDKYSNSNETVIVHIILQNGVGDYELKFEYSELDNHSNIYDTASINVRWKPIFTPEPGPAGGGLGFSLPEVPNTGYYVYVAGYAINLSIFLLFVCGIIIAIGAKIMLNSPKKKCK